MAKDVLCAVNSCTYWAEENKCNADSIFVAYHSSSSLHNLRKQIAKPSKVNNESLQNMKEPSTGSFFLFSFYQE